MREKREEENEESPISQGNFHFELSVGTGKKMREGRNKLLA